MELDRIALYGQMRAFRTGRACPEAIRALEERGLLHAQWGMEERSEHEEFAATLATLEDEYRAFAAKHPKLAPLPIPADPPPGTAPRRLFDT